MSMKHRMLKRNIHANLNIYMHTCKTVLGACRCKYMSQTSLTVESGKLSSCNTKPKQYGKAISHVHIYEIFICFRTSFIKTLNQVRIGLVFLCKLIYACQCMACTISCIYHILHIQCLLPMRANFMFCYVWYLLKKTPIKATSLRYVL